MKKETKNKIAENNDNVKKNRVKSSKKVVSNEPFLYQIDKSDFFDNEESKREYIVNKKARRHLYFSYTFRFTLKIILLIVFVYSGVYSFMMIKKAPTIKTSNYQINGTVDYKVKLKKNDYYDSDTLDSNMKYIASLINQIKLDYDYNFYSPDKYNLKYSYYVTAKVKVYDAHNSSQIIFQTDRTILEKKEKEIKDNNFKIADTLDIDYDSYNQLIKNFKQDYNLYANSSVIYSLHIKVIGIHDEIEEVLEENNTIDLTIPLTEQTVDIELSSNNIKVNKSISGTLKDEERKDLVAMGVFIGSVVLFMVVLISLMLLLTKGTRKKSKYNQELSRILKDYDRAIAKTKDIVNLSDEDNIIDIDTFTGLLDIRDNLNLPILYAEIHKGSKALFIIKNGHDIYRYVLKGVDLGDE